MRDIICLSLRWKDKLAAAVVIGGCGGLTVGPNLGTADACLPALHPGSSSTGLTCPHVTRPC
jgi:hypothetical protein